MEKSHFRIYITLLLLYIAQSVPMSFFSSALPAIMREEGYSLHAIGLLQFVKLPWILKILWAPLVDKKAFNLHLLRRAIIGSEILYGVIILIIGFFSLETNFNLIAILVVISIVVSATQDICTDSFSIKVLEPKTFSSGATVQSMGGFIGAFIGGGVLLVIYGLMGWQSLINSISIFVVLSLIPLLIFSKRVAESKDNNQQSKGVKFSDIATFFKEKGAKRHTLFLLLYSSSIMLVLAMIRPLMVDCGFSIGEIGVTMGVIGTLVATASSMLIGVLVAKRGIKMGVTLSSSLIFAALLALFLIQTISANGATRLSIYLVVALIWAAHGGATTITYHFSMTKSRLDKSATDFTLQSVMIQLSGLLLSVAGSFIAASFSYVALFGVALVMAIITVIYNLNLIKNLNDAK